MLRFPEFELVIYAFRRSVVKLRELFKANHRVRAIIDACKAMFKERRESRIKRHDLMQAMLDAEADDDQSSNEFLTATAEERDDQDDGPRQKLHNRLTLTRDEIIGNLMLFMFAGYETTSSTLTICTHFLVNHQDLQEKLRQELQQVLRRDGKFDYANVMQLEYLNAFICEALRLIPPVQFFVTRLALEDYEYDGRVIPKGTGIVVSANKLHNDPDVYPRPEVFDPDRFCGEGRQLANSVYWMPFGHGPRNCVGMRFALLEVKLALANLLTRFRLEPGPRTEIGRLSVNIRSVVTPVHGVFVKVVPIAEQRA